MQMEIAEPESITERLRDRYMKGCDLMCDVTREQFEKWDWKCSYEEYVACYCPDCNAKDCKHREAYRDLEDAGRVYDAIDTLLEFVEELR